MDYNTPTKEAYEKYAHQFQKQYERHFKKYTLGEAQSFVDLIKIKGGKHVLDLGCGPGVHAEYFAQEGLDVLGVDNSPKMINLYQERARKNPNMRAIVSDLEKLDLADSRYDGAWAYTSLLHLPREQVPKLKNKLVRSLRSEGLFAVAVIEGDGEAFLEDPDYPGVKRWFTYFSDAEMRLMFGREFEIVSSITRSSRDWKYLAYHFKLRPEIK